MRLIASFPLFSILLAVYVIMMAVGADFHGVVVNALLPSGATWEISAGELLIALGVAILYVEIIKATLASHGSTMEHALSLVLFIVFLIMFIVVPGAGTSTFLVLTLMSLLDVVGGFTISIAAARRDISLRD